MGLYDAFAPNKYKRVKIIRRNGYATVEYAPSTANPQATRGSLLPRPRNIAIANLIFPKHRSFDAVLCHSK